MREEKRRRLERSGWRVGDAREFLALEPDEDAYIELRLRLATGLRKRRERRGMTQAELARAVGSSQSRVAKMEAGDPTVSLDLLIRTLLGLGASYRELGALIARKASAPRAA